MSRTLLTAGLLALVSLGCAEASVTELVVVVDTDLAVPGYIDEIAFEISGPDAIPRTPSQPVDASTIWPQTLGLVHESGPLGPVNVRVRGLLNGQPRIDRRATTNFVRGEIRILRMDLLKACTELTCPSTQTCGPTGCRPLLVTEDELERWDGVAPPYDAGVMDMGNPCVPVPEVCNELDDDCDTFIDEDFDFQNDVFHCGNCTTACPTEMDNATGVCVNGQCDVECDPNFGDCDTLPGNGCEDSFDDPATCGDCDTACMGATPLCSATGCTDQCDTGFDLCTDRCVDLQSNMSHCGSCPNACTAPPNALAGCTTGMCTYACDSGFFECDTLESTGCESRHRELENCGGCGMTCDLANAVESCATGDCAVVGCEGTFGDCDGIPDTGCETDVSRTLAYCGDCMTACPTTVANGTPICLDGQCDVICEAGFANCDNRVDTGCETSLADRATCGACSIACENVDELCVLTPTGYRCLIDCPGTMCPSGCTDTTSDVNNCNGCDLPCNPRPNMTRACVSSACDYQCLPGWGDCMTTDPLDGCETPTNDVAHCNNCTTSCNFPNATSICATGGCQIVQCAPGWDDCDPSMANGCETDITTVSDCGGCGAACPALGPGATGNDCVGGNCVVTTCVTGWDDCDDAYANGCETNTNTNRNHCGMCNNNCGQGGKCCSGTCQMGGMCP